ncbi:MAG: glutamate formimidoyltransferase [Euryarchaeota archaeon]|nr:glutamate formimidoyltransferase [Euryarchaeota archaeon]
MQGTLVECVPNFSEGRDKQVIEKITRPIRDANGVSLLDVDMGHDFNRTVVTMVGAPEEVLSTVIECTRIAIELIDMRVHSGEHARMGAVDVVPFIPIQGISMDDCVTLSERYAQAVSEELGLPIYLYAEAARTPQRSRLPDIRRGQYEGMSEKVTSPEWKPDYGPAEFKPKMGVTATGARAILIAYNVNLDTDDKSKANSIAAKIRTSGSLVKDENGERIVGDDGKPLRKPGMFQSLQAAGWMFDPTTAQVSMNLLDYNVTGLHEVTEAIRIEAGKIGLNVTAGELVGLVPLNAMKSAGNYYHNDDLEMDEEEIVQKAISGLMLDRLGEFDSKSCIIEWAIDRGPDS